MEVVHTEAVHMAVVHMVKAHMVKAHMVKAHMTVALEAQVARMVATSMASLLDQPIDRGLHTTHHRLLLNEEPSAHILEFTIPRRTPDHQPNDGL